MRKELATQLEEFLEKGMDYVFPHCFLVLTYPVEGPSFIDALFNVLRTKSYLPYTTGTTAVDSLTSTGIPIPLDALLSPSWSSSQAQGVKRSFDVDDSDPRPTKGPRLRREGDFSRNGGDNQPIGGWRSPNARRGWHDAHGAGDGAMGVSYSVLHTFRS
jgi:RNA-binding protein 26